MSEIIEDKLTIGERQAIFEILFPEQWFDANSYYINIEEEEWDRVLEVNAKGVYLVTKVVVPYMTQSKRGRIINISSVVVQT